MSTIIIADPPTSYPYPSRDRSNPIGPTIRRCPNLPYGQGLRNWKKKKSLESPFDLSETIPHNRWKPLVFSLSLSYISNLLNLTLSSTSRLIRRWKAGKVTLFHSVPLSFIPLPSYLTIQTISVSRRSLPLPLSLSLFWVTVPLERLNVYQMIRDSVELNVPEAVASADITEDYSVILSGTRDRMPRRGLDRNEGVVARKKWACIFRLDPRISFRTNEIYNISVNYSTSFVTEFYIKINEIDNSRNSLKNWKKSFLLSRIKYITISSREEEEISRSNSLSLRPPPLETPPIIRQLRLHSVVRDRFQEGWFRLINMAGYRVF